MLPRGHGARPACANSVNTFRTLLLRTFDRLDCAANAILYSLPAVEFMP